MDYWIFGCYLSQAQKKPESRDFTFLHATLRHFTPIIFVGAKGLAGGSKTRDSRNGAEVHGGHDVEYCAIARRAGAILPGDARWAAGRGGGAAHAALQTVWRVR